LRRCAPSLPIDPAGHRPCAAPRMRLRQRRSPSASDPPPLPPRAIPRRSRSPAPPSKRAVDISCDLLTEFRKPLVGTTLLAQLLVDRLSVGLDPRRLRRRIADIFLRIFPTGRELVGRFTRLLRLA